MEFADFYCLKSHIDIIPKNLRPFQCKICSKAFTRNSRLKEHVDQIHYKIEPFKCKICFKTFGQKYSKQEHD